MHQENSGSAFPITEQNGANSGDCGMTLRDYFAAKVLQSFIAGANGVDFGRDHAETNLRYAKAAYCVADAMLDARDNKERKND